MQIFVACLVRPYTIRLFPVISSPLTNPCRYTRFNRYHRPSGRDNIYFQILDFPKLTISDRTVPSQHVDQVSFV